MKPIYGHVAEVKSNDDATEIYGTLDNPSIIPKGKVEQGQFSESMDDLEGYSQTLLSLETTSTRLVGELFTSMKICQVHSAVLCGYRPTSLVLSLGL